MPWDDFIGLHRKQKLSKNVCKAAPEPKKKKSNMTPMINSGAYCETSNSSPSKSKRKKQKIMKPNNITPAIYQTLAQQQPPQSVSLNYLNALHQQTGQNKNSTNNSTAKQDTSINTTDNHEIIKENNSIQPQANADEATIASILQHHRNT
eukprot:UN34316